LKIVAFETFPVDIPTRPEFTIVSSLGVHRISRYVLVAIRTSDGATGYGEATVMPIWSGETQAGAIAAIRDELAPVLIGRDPHDVQALSDAMDRALIGNPFTKAAIEMALWDLQGKIAGKPVCELLGGPCRPLEIPLKFSIGAFPPARAAAVAETMAQRGFRAVKVKVGLELKEDLSRVSAVRSAVGADFRVAVDANGGWTEEAAIAALPELERLGVNAIEQPLHRRDLRGSARLRKRTRIPILLDEAVFTLDDALEAIYTEACDMISIYPGKNGGIAQSMQISRAAKAAGLQCVIGSNLEWEIGSAAMLHLAVAMPNLADAVDHDIIGPIYHGRRTSSPPIAIANGKAILPTGLGLGVELDHALVASG
jgi:L-alanine-DL-glutamate epimerase-like enolase superfamily enzyme